MTQLLLFDAPECATQPPVFANRLAATGLAAAAELVREPGKAKLTNGRSSLRELAEQIAEGRRRLHEHERGGVQRLGDLAQLVLLQHDLVARRRAALAANESGQY